MSELPGDGAVHPVQPVTGALHRGAPDLATPQRGYAPFAVPWTSIRERFAVVAAALPDELAVVCRGESITYAALHARAAAGARALVSRLGGVRRPVAIDTDCSLDCVVTIVTILLSGNPLVLLDSRLPDERRTDILARSGALRYRAADLEPADAGAPLPAVARTDTAVLLFTSGSTGRPKAVRQGQRQWLNQAADFHTTLGIGAGDRVGMALPISFGGGMDVVVSALLNGATLHYLDPREIGSDALPQWIPGEALTTLHATPSLLRAVLTVCAGGPALGRLRLVTTCGEAVHGDDVTALRTQLGPHSVYCNLSGSSETGNLAFNVFPPERPIPDRVLPVGVVAANKTVRLLGPDDTPVRPGEVGEIVVDSDYLAEGYHVDRDGGAGADVDRFGVTAAGARYFRMGDLGRFDGNGDLHLVGRGDDAVKVRGYLVEPAEVESALRRLPAVNEAVVLARSTDAGPALVGYAAVRPDGRAPSAADLRRDLRAALPDWMIPAHLVLLPALPRNERGKVDRSALPGPAPRPPVVPPAAGTETDLAALWAEILGVERVGRDDDFTALGGDSLQTQQMLTRAGERFGVALTSATLANHPTLHRFAGHLDAHAGGAGGSVLVPLSPTGTGTPVFAVAGAGSTALALLPLARELDRPVYGLQAHGLEGRGLPDWTVAAAARRYLREIRRVQPRGPYTLVGHSLGGVIAMEVARRLEAAEDTVHAVVCLDTLLGGPLSVGGPNLPRTADTPPAVAAAPPSRHDLWRTRLRLVTAGLVPRPAQQQWDLFHEVGRRVALLHRLRPWHGRVAVVMAEDNPDDPAWWPIVAPNVVAVDRVPGDHVGMLRAPHVARTAALVRTALEPTR
ncbi:AMP-binding protein [Rhodococcus sp. NPDC058505]|uniref:AMP-binding protein n=1 Tax=unclassified Rhodococcus (in: high G+C Gram-positive bacteria) TaxID=192944 RepID=UPI00365C0AE5